MFVVSTVLLLLLKDINAFIQPGCIRLYKSDSEYIYIAAKHLFQMNADFFTFLILRRILKKNHGIHKNIHMHKSFQH